MEPTLPTPTLRISTEVLVFGAQQGVTAHLPAVIELTELLFPEALRINLVDLQEHPLPPYAPYIQVEVAMPKAAWSHHLKIRKTGQQWWTQLLQLVPGNLAGWFGLGTEPIPEP